MPYHNEDLKQNKTTAAYSVKLFYQNTTGKKISTPLINKIIIFFYNIYCVNYTFGAQGSLFTCRLEWDSLWRERPFRVRFEWRLGPRCWRERQDCWGGKIWAFGVQLPHCPGLWAGLAAQQHWLWSREPKERQATVCSFACYLHVWPFWGANFFNVYVKLNNSTT